MSIVIYLGRNIKEYEEKSEEIITRKLEDGTFCCEECLRPLRLHSSYERGIKETGERIEITVLWCRSCRKWHSLLPDFLLPNKHYSGNEIESVIIDSADTEMMLIETSASESTVRRWINQLEPRIRQSIGILKYHFRKMGIRISEVSIDAGMAYSELEQALAMAPKRLKYSGNRLGLANMWLRATGLRLQL